MKSFVAACIMFALLIVTVAVLSSAAANTSKDLLSLADKAYSEIAEEGCTGNNSLNAIYTKWQSMKMLISNVSGDSRAERIDEAIAEMIAASKANDTGSIATSISRLRVLINSVIESEKLTILGIL